MFDAITPVEIITNDGTRYVRQLGSTEFVRTNSSFRDEYKVWISYAFQREVRRNGAKRASPRPKQKPSTYG